MEGGDSKMKVTNLCVLKDTWMAKNSGVPSLNILSETFSHRCSLGSSAHAENVLGNPNPIRLEGQPCSALLTGGGRSFAWFPLLSVALQGLCFSRSLFWLIFTARYVLSSPNIWILALLKGQSLKYSVKLVETSFSFRLCFLHRFGKAFCFLSLMFRIGIYTFSIAKYSLASLLTGYRVMAMYGFARQDRPNVWNGFVWKA